MALERAGATMAPSRAATKTVPTVRGVMASKKSCLKCQEDDPLSSLLPRAKTHLSVGLSSAAKTAWSLE